MTGGQRILLNTFATYGRTLLAIFLGLFSSRWVLAALGDIDYGLMGVVGSILVFITFLNSLSSSATSRYFAFSIGQNDVEETRKWFNSALTFSVLLPATLSLLGLLGGEIAIRYFLSIPSDRLTTALWVFRFSLITAFITMVCSPFMAMYTAKQNIAELSLWGISLSLTNFIFVYNLSRFDDNKWLIYSAGISLISISFTLMQAWRAHNKYEECKINLKYWFNKKRLKEMVSYSFWTLFGALGGIFYGNGLAIVLNKFFPPNIYPSVNASYSIGNTVTGQTQNVSGALLGAFMPEIVTTEGRGDRNGVIRLVLRASRLSFVIISIIVIPIFFQTDYILTLWLKTPPEYASTFCRALLIAFLVMKLIGGYDAAICATGKIKKYQLIMSTFSYATVFMSALLYWIGFGLFSICWVIIGYGIINTLGGVYFGRIIVGIPVKSWLAKVIKPVSISLLISFMIGIIMQNLLENFSETTRFFAVTPVLLVTTSLCGWFFLTETSERAKIKNMIRGFINKSIRKKELEIS